MASVEKTMENNIIIKQILDSLLIKQESGKKELLEDFLKVNNLDDARKVMIHFVSRKV
jgi:hypothetical protein